MKTLIKLLSFMAITCLVLSCNKSDIYDEVSEPVLKRADIPIPNLVGTMDLTLSFTSETNFWNGTVDFGDYGVFSIAFFTYTPPRDFSQVYPFEEDFIIYKLGTNWTDPENIYLKGSHQGLLKLAKTPIEFIVNGKITEAYFPLAFCMGRPYHCKGTVDFNTGTCDVEIRIN
ncbi:MAG TPA: hypothetical protein VMV74_04060 [Bacteroidales bacterium]|nr:hypothetical protein [Bacteroidales bacterium]